MKLQILRKLIPIVCLLVSSHAFAYDFEVDGIYYNITSTSDLTVEVTYGLPISCSNYVDEIIPATVNYDNKTYSVTAIGEKAFSECENLSTITIPNSVISIGNYAFQYCESLTTITIPNSVTSIGESAFSESGLTSITIPNSVLTIGESAFWDCDSLTNITIPNSVTSIGDDAFADCGSLFSITIPKSVSDIGDYAFSYCENLTSIIVESGNPVYDSRDNCNAIIETTTNNLIAGCKNTIIPNTVTCIKEESFSGSGITSIIIPKSVTSIDDYAFCSCYNLASIKCLGTTPPDIDSFTFSGLPESATLYVPEGCKATYATATGWKSFSNIVEFTSNYFTMSSAELYKGKTVTIPVELNNLNEYTAFECTLTLPDGVTCSKVSLSDRATDHTITKSQTIDGTVKFAAISFSLSPFTGSDGVLFNIELTASDDIIDGDYAISLKNIKFSTVDATEHQLADVTATLTLKTAIKGDANGDGSVSITDAVTIVNYIMGNILSSFVFVAADINESGDISITDAVGTISLLLSQNVSALSMNANSTQKSVTKPKALLTNENNSLYIDDVTVVAGTEKTVYLRMDNTTDYCAFSADIHLPEGVSVTNKVLSSGRIIDHMLSSSTPADNVLRLAALSFSNAAFIGNSGDPLVELTLSFDESFTGGTITINNVELSTASMDYCKPAETTTTISIDDPTGINDIEIEENTSIEYYNLQGVRVMNPTKGLYIKKQGNKATKVIF